MKKLINLVRKFALIVLFLASGIAIYWALVTFFEEVSLEVATGVMAIGTLALAFITYWNIQSNNARENRERKDRLLNEISQWITDMNRWPIDNKIFKEMSALNDMWQAQRLQLAHIAEVKTHFVTLLNNSEYMIELSKTFKQGLTETLREMIGEANSYRDFLSDWHTTLAKELETGLADANKLEQKGQEGDGIVGRLEEFVNKVRVAIARIKSRRE